MPASASFVLALPAVAIGLVAVVPACAALTAPDDPPSGRLGIAADGDVCAPSDDADAAGDAGDSDEAASLPHAAAQNSIPKHHLSVMRGNVA